MQNLVKIMGPGCGNKAVEHCPPEYHFELTTEQMEEAIRDPRALGKKLNLNREITSISISAAENQSAIEAQPMYCCRTCLSNSVCCMPWPQ